MADLNELQNDMNKITLTVEGEDFDSFLYCNIESTDLVVIVDSSTISRTDDDLGRVVIATKDVSVGTRIIRERPVLVYKHGAWLELVSAFVALDQESKNGVLNMFHPPPKLSIMPEAYLIASQLSLDPMLVQKLILISKFNAHQYHGYDQERFSEVVSFSPSSAGKLALFLFSSKVAHSCNPNVTYSSRTSDGKLEYRVIRPVNTGDMITFSYIDELLETPTHIRRTTLIKSKEFLCRCPRCKGPDFSRAISCNTCRSSGVKEALPVGLVVVVGELDRVGELRIAAMENEIKQNLDDWDYRMTTNLSSCFPVQFEKVVRTSSELHPHHYLTLQAMKMYVRLCASQAVQMENLSKLGYPRSTVASIHRKFGSPDRLRSDAARMGISIIEKLECIAVGCNGPESSGERCTKQHAPVQDASQHAFHVAQDMMQCSSSVWPANGPNTVHRYIPAFRLQYGKEDEDVVEIELRIPSPKDKEGNHTSPIKKKPLLIPSSQSHPSHSNSNQNPNNYYDHPVGECAINLFGLPRSFKYYVLPSLIKNIIQINNRYQCDYYIHYFNVTIEQSGAGASANTSSNSSSRGGNNGGIITPNDVLLLHDAVLQVSSAASSASASIKNGNIQQQQPQPQEQIIKFVSDTDHDFEIERKTYINEIVYNINNDRGDRGSDDRVNQNKNSSSSQKNPYHIHEKSFTDRTLINILKMWHSQDKVWNLMDANKANKNNNANNNANNNSKKKKQYNRVAMLRLDVIYTTPIDIYYVPYDPIPIDYNDDYLKGLRKIRGTQKKDIQYFYDYYNNNMNCVLPGFKSFPVNDRYFVGPYQATKIWAKDRFSRAKSHVLNVLPALEQQRLIEQIGSQQEKQQSPVEKQEGDEATTTAIMKMTDYGLHDEKFVAYTILPAIRRELSNSQLQLQLQLQSQSQLKNTSSSSSIIQSNQNQIQSQNDFIHVDRELYFVRVRADGSIWLKDKPGYGRVKTTVLESVLNRSCAGSKPYEVYDDILGDKSPGKWQIKCPPLAS
ncbi:hypothetical protein FRACYDRAFT_252779 [Fragilariopsis cylindrus CCMP1102]|uniref:SET domain-containing protein n=1 Tax=Fragilariopsis cylindrus CCMP1102 TaxID=635003 RepID=A0A1E7EMS1_9STRA|nr:hypothetical protein FRACYDRAFT_252779 [Fragilariopsis cylindrus CCMP1102]|eukprot:OEU06873.1 hypothetical protein FRACYDRAFT_252779 [Fragilariopsis cylindrus CCMP1102]